MKKAIFVFMFVVLFSSTAFAVIDLQVYIPNAPYYGTQTDDWLSQSWVSSSSTFELWVIAANYDICDVYLPMAVPEGESGNISLTPFGSTTPIPYSTPSDFSVGIPSSGLQPLPKHGIYPTLYTEHKIGYIPWGSETVNDMAGTGSATGSILKFNVSVSGFSRVHFDAYGYYEKQNGDKQFTKAPFSHDSTYNIPEPATLSLLSLGFLGFGFARKKRRGTR